MPEVVLLSKGPEETERIGEILGGSLVPGSVVMLTGPLGAGKTMFVKGLAKALGIPAPVVSPSYTIAAEYEGDLPLTHIDLYRIGTDEELELLGFDELSAGAGVTVVEWGEKAVTFLDETTVRVTITLLAADQRRIAIGDVPEELADSLRREFQGAGV